MSADRNLLFGILALQLDFITRDQLIAGMQTWVLEKTRPLAEILQSAGALSAANRQLLEPLVARHIEQHNNDPQQSLASLSAIGSATAGQLASLVDPEVNASLPFVGAARVSELEATVSAGQPTSASGRFRVLRFHAAGGLGQVSVARDSELNRDVALKEIKSEYAANAVARGRFVLEAEITGGLEHPSIVPVYGLGTYDDGRPFYAMRFIKGDTLKQAIDRYHDPERAKKTTDSERVLELRQLLGRFIDVCQAVEYAHSRGVLHRDLKPGNVMLGKYGETLVVDWGLAKACGKQEDASPRNTSEMPLEPTSGSSVEPTMIGERIGTLQYMSPEQSTGQLDQLGPATDVFSLGATLYHLLTGKTPYHATTKDDLIACVANANFPKPRSVLKSIPKPLEAICLKALAAKPADRYASAQALLNDIEKYLADEPVTAFQEPLTVRVRRWARKRPGFVSATLATVAVTLIALLTGTVLLGHKNRQLAEKEAVATAIKNFLLYDLLELALPEVQAREGVAVNPDLTVQELLTRAGPKIDRQFASQPAVAAQLKALAAQPAGPGLTVRQLVSRAAEKLTGRFADQPFVERDAREVIGSALGAIGDHAASIPHLERCRSLSSQHLGAHHFLTLMSMADLATAYRGTGRYREALQLTEETLELRRSTLGPHHRATFDSMIDQAACCQALGRVEQAVALFEECHRNVKARLGPSDPVTLRAVTGLAGAYDRAGRHAEAHSIYQDCLKLSIENVQPDHPDIVGALYNLSDSYRELGNYEMALHYARKAVLEGTSKLGADHPQTVRAMNNLAAVFLLAGHDEEAVKLFEKSVAIQKVKLGENHPDTLRLTSNLANCYHDIGRLSDALPLYENVLQRERELLGNEHHETMNSMTNLAMALEDAGRIDEAIALYEEALEGQEAKLGRKHQETLATLGGLASALLEAGRDLDSLRLHEESVQLRKGTLGADHPQTLGAMLNLAIALERVGRTDEAIVGFEQTLVLMRKKLGSDHPNSLIAMGNLGKLYSRTDRAAEGMALMEEVLQRRRDKWGNFHPDTLHAMSNLAVSYSRAGRYAEAISLCQETLKGREKALGSEHPETLDAMFNLGLGFIKAERDDEAIPVLDEAQKLMRKKLPPAHPTTLQALETLVSACERTGRLEESLPAYRELIELKGMCRGPKHLDTIRTLFNLARNQRQLKERNDAETSLLFAFAATETFAADSQAQVRQQIALELVKLYDDWQKPEEANKWRKELLRLAPGK